MRVDSVLPNEYGGANFVCERMFDAALHRSPESFRVKIVRLAKSQA